MVAGADRMVWVLLAYKLPREPSTPRITLWRQLRKLGAVQLLDGLVALPLDSRNRERFEWLAAQVTEAGGEATVWTGQVATRAEERVLIDRMCAAVTVEYRGLITAAEAAAAEPAGRRRRTLARLRRGLQTIRGRDYFPPLERELATQAVEELAAQVVSAA